MKKLFLLALIVNETSILIAQTKQAEDLFKSWITEQSYYQRCLPDIKQQDLKADQSSLTFATHTEAFKTQLLSIAGNKQDNLDAKKIEFIRRLAANNTPDFINRLHKAGFVGSTINALDHTNKYHDVIARYVGVFDTLFSDQTIHSPTREFGIANRFFEFCFTPKTFPQFRKIMQHENAKPLGRFLYTSLWQKLVGTGWVYWHQDTLNRLKNVAKKGKTIVYVAGGSDIYQLLANDVYNIRIIDPYLEGSQDKYYSHSWQFLLRGDGEDYGRGDELHFSFPTKKVVMRRKAVQPGTPFSTDIATGESITIPADIITWDVYENEERKGRITIERRQAEQRDFDLKKNEELLMSFNELYFVALPEHLNGWAINTHQFADDINIHVKQLRKPVTKKIIENMVWADEHNLSFMRLGSCAR